jgi:hypothetical protein
VSRIGASPADTDAAAREGDAGLCVALSAESLSPVECPVVAVSERAAGGSEEGVFEVVVGVAGALPIAGLTRLSHDRREARGAGQGGGGAE